MQTIDLIFNVIILAGLIVNLHENRKIMKFDDQICDTVYKSIDALDKKTTAQDNFIWTSMIMMAKRIARLEQSHGKK